MPFPAIERNQVGQDLISKPKVKDSEESSFPLLQWKTKALNKQDARATESTLQQEKQAGCRARERAWEPGCWHVYNSPQRNKTTDTEAQPTAYLEGSYHSLGVRILAIHLSETVMFLDITETPLRLVGQKNSTGESRGMPQVMA